jgi:AbiV family abortive infection protein
MTSKSPFTEGVIKSMQACIEHARDLIDAAKLVQTSDKPNIAYHLAALALEELGRRELIGFQTIANATSIVPPTWPMKHTQDHVQKMFWAFFGAMFRTKKITKEGFEEIRSFAQHIHSRRIAGLYVDTSDGLNVPREAIPSRESEILIGLVEARLGMASTEEYRSEATQHNVDIQDWFLAATEDEGKRNLIFSDVSMTKLADLGDTREWIEWLKNEFDAAHAQAMKIVKRELEKTPATEKPESTAKWKMRLRLFADAHSIRPKALSWWNKQVTWINLVAIPERKREIIIEITFNSDLHLERLWLAGWIVARQFVAALNLGAGALWWWHLPRQISRYYDRVEDVENGMEVKLDRTPILKAGWGVNLVLDETALRQTMIQLTVVTRLVGSEAWSGVEYYLAGLTFLSLNEIHWQCEVQAYGNFHHCLKTVMKIYGGWDGIEPFDEAFSRLLGEAAPEMPNEQSDRYATIARAYEANTPLSVSIDLADAGLIKVLCDRFFASAVAPVVLSQAEAERQQAFS